jgi:hypothetical protein
MASLNTDDREHLSILAASKQDAALKVFRPELENITLQNCDAIFAFSFLAEYYIPASAGTVINPAATFMEDDFFDAIVDWIRLHQGTSDIYKRKGHWIQHGPLASLLWSDVLSERFETTARETNSERTQTHQLHNLARIWETGTASTTREFHENQINSQALQILIEAFHLALEVDRANTGRLAANELLKNPRLSKYHTSQTAQSSNYLSLSFGWLFEIPFGFVELLEQRQPAALIIFAHFSMLFQKAPKFWWNEPIPAKIVKAVAAVLPQEYYRWIECPIREVLGADCYAT